MIQIKGGHFEGEKLRGRVVTGGCRLEYGSRRRHGGYRKLQEPYSQNICFQTDDGVYIAIENLGYKYADQEKNMSSRPVHPSMRQEENMSG